MYEVLIYAALATVVCVMMYSILGKQTGFGGRPDEKTDLHKFGMEKGGGAALTPLQQQRAEQEQARQDQTRRENDRLGLSAILAADPHFSVSSFMDGASAAYSMILEAYASGDRDLLKELLTTETYAVYEAAISAREALEQTQVTDLGRLLSASIERATLDGHIARIHVIYKAELTSALVDAQGQVVDGDLDVLSSVSEVWEYERDLRSKDPNWRLADVAASTGDTQGVDPSPDTKPA